MNPMTGMTTLTIASAAQIRSDFLEGEPPGEGDDPTGEEDRNHVRTNINPLRGEGSGRTTNETRRFKEHDTAKVPNSPQLAGELIRAKSLGGPRRVRTLQALIHLRAPAKTDSSPLT